MEFMKFDKGEVRHISGHDPGGTTGLAFAEYDENEVRIQVLGQIGGGREGYLYAFDGLRFGWPTTHDLVSEQWVDRAIPGADQEPVYIEGVQYALWQDNVYYQTPDMKSLIPDDKLRELGIWTEGKRHQMDALIHLLVWLRNQGHKPTIEALSNGGGGIRMVGGEPGDGEGQQPGEGEGDPIGALRAAMEDALGGPGGDQNGQDLGWQITEDIRKRRDRDLNGAFTGFDVAEEESASATTLYDQKF